jgi:hypothetical protein
MDKHTKVSMKQHLQTDEKNEEFEVMTIPTREKIEEFESLLNLERENDLIERDKCRKMYFELKEQGKFKDLEGLYVAKRWRCCFIQGSTRNYQEGIGKFNTFYNESWK